MNEQTEREILRRLQALEDRLSRLENKVSPAVDRYGVHKESIFGPGHDGYGTKENEREAIERGNALGRSLRDRIKVGND